jgi:hypothetical protein
MVAAGHLGPASVGRRIRLGTAVPVSAANGRWPVQATPFGCIAVVGTTA